MKIQNYQTVIEKMSQYEKTDKLLNDLDGQISLVITDNGYKVMTIGAWVTCEHVATDIAIEFVTNLKQLYANRLSQLKTEIEAL